MRPAVQASACVLRPPPFERSRRARRFPSAHAQWRLSGSVRAGVTWRWRLQEAEAAAGSRLWRSGFPSSNVSSSRPSKGPEPAALAAPRFPACCVGGGVVPPASGAHAQQGTAGVAVCACVMAAELSDCPRYRNCTNTAGL